MIDNVKFEDNFAYYYAPSFSILLYYYHSEVSYICSNIIRINRVESKRNFGCVEGMINAFIGCFKLDVQ